jgi:hypothetical protein
MTDWILLFFHYFQPKYKGSPYIRAFVIFIPWHPNLAIRKQVSQSLRSVLLLLVTANVAPSSPILFTLIMEAILSFEMLVLTKATRRNTLEEGILHSHCRENLISYRSVLFELPQQSVGLPKNLRQYYSVAYGNIFW